MIMQTSSSNASNMIPSGIYTPIPTFFTNQKDAVDYSTLEKHVKMLAASRITGVVVSGSMGEGTNLTLHERVRSIEVARGAVTDSNFKIIAGAGLGCVADIVEESQLTASKGADFLMVLVPGYFGPNLVSQEGIIDYFEQVADKSALPLIIYNYPNTCNNVNLTFDTFKKLSEHPNIVGVKLTHYNFDMYTLLGHDPTFEANNFKSFTGLGQVLGPALSVSLFGAIDGLSGIFPKTMVRLYELYTSGKQEEAAKLQWMVTKVDLMVTELNVLGVKYALNQIYDLGEKLEGRAPLSKPVNISIFDSYTEDILKLREYENSI